MRRIRFSATYTLFLPIWLFVWFPSLLWLVLIPANYLVDRFVLRLSMPKDGDRDVTCRNHAWKVCVAGFLSDFLGCAFLFGMTVILDIIEAGALPDYRNSVGYALTFDPWGNPMSVIISIIAVLISASCMYRLDGWILSLSGFAPEQAKKSALWLSVATAPCMFLLPSGLLYGTVL